MRKSMIPSVSARVRHWGVAAVAAVIAAVWVTMSLIVPSLAQNDNSGAQPVSQSMNVQPAGSRIAGAAPLQLGTPSGMALTGATTRSKQYDTLLTGQAVHYSNGAAAYCAEPSKSSLAGATQGGIAYVDPSVAPYAMSASGSALSSADLQKLYKGLSDAAASTGGSGLVRDFALQKAAWELAGYPTTLMTKLDWEWATKSIRLGFLSKDKGYWLTKSQNEQADALAQQLIAQAKANAAKYQTNAEMLKSIQVQIVDGDKAGQKKVVLTGSDEAIAALKAGSDFAQTTITVTVNGKQVTGSVQQAVNGGIPVDVVCQDGKAKISAKWSGHIEVKGVYTSVPSNEDQAKIIVTPVQLQVQGSADVEVPCDTPSTPTPTPTPAKITVKTQAKDQADQDQEIVAGKPATIVDTVTMTGLVPGNEYTISGKLMNQETKAEVPGVIGSTTFTAKQANETQTVEFKLTAEQTKGLKAGVVFETLTQKTAGKDGDTDLNGKVVGSHEEITDGAQTITVKKPEAAPITVKTSAKDQTTGEKTIVKGKPATIVDTVTMTGLVPGNEYTISGVLMDKDTQKAVEGVTGSKTFTASKADETQDVTFTVPAEATKTLKAGVVFETLTQKTAGKDGDSELNGKVVADHKKIDDADQTVTVTKPEAEKITVKTQAKDKDTDSQTIVAGKPATVVDTVTMTGLVPGNEYTISGKLMNQETKAEVPGVIGSTTFTAKQANETQTVEFKLTAEQTKGLKAGVVFETLTQKTAGKDGDTDLNGKVVGSHEEITDGAQTITIKKPEAAKITVKTSAKDKDSQSQTIVAGKAATVVDTVTMTGLVPGNEYTISGVLMDKDTQKAIEGVTGSKTFTATKADETQTVEFTIPEGATKDLKAAVVFETLTQKTAGNDGDHDLDGKVVADHKSIDDAAQTITITKPTPKLGAFQVTKKAVNDDKATLPKSYGFEYFCGDAAAQPTEWKPLDGVVADGSASVEKITAGQTCWLREKDAAVDGAKLTTSWLINGANPQAGQTFDKGVKFTITENTQVAIQATNTYVVPKGHVTVSKQVTDSTEGKLAKDKKFSFTYVCANGEGADKKVADGTVEVAAGGQAQLPDVPAGTICAIAEKDAQVADANLATSWTVAGKPANAADLTWGGVQLKGAVKSLAVEAGSDVAVAAHNVYSDTQKASFTVTKQTTGSESAALKDTAFTFDYACGDAKGTFTLKPGESFASAEKGLKLKPGTSCTVTEQKPARVPGTTFEGVTFNRTSGEGDFTSNKDASSVTFTLADATKPVVFTAVNTYVDKKPVTPELKTTLVSDGLKQVDLTGKADDAQVTFTDTVTYRNLVGGHTYYVEGTLVDGTGKPIEGMHAVSKGIEVPGDADTVVNGTATMQFTLPAGLLKTTDKVVAFEKLWDATQLTSKPVAGSNEIAPKAGEQPTAKHEDVNDAAQTVAIVHPTPEAPKVKVSLVKKINGEDPGLKSYDFTLACGDDSQHVQLIPNQPTTVGLKPGTKCTLTETAPSVENWTHAVTFTGKGVEVTANGLEATFTVPNQPAADGVIEVMATNSYTPPEQPQIEIGTVATNANAEGDAAKVLTANQAATIKDVTSWKNLPAGDYVLVPTLKSVSGDTVTDVKGATAATVPFAVEKGKTSGEVVSTLSVPAESVVPEAHFVVFERIYKAADVTATGVKDGATPVATHEDPKAESQTVTVTKPEPKPTSLRIAKIAKAADGTEIADHEFKFDLTCQAGDKTIEKKGLTLKSSQTSDAIEVPAGATCQIVEDGKLALINNQTPTLTWSANVDTLKVASDGLKGSFTVPEGDGTQITVTVTNTYPKPEQPETPTPSTPTTTPTTPCDTPTPTPSTSTPGTPDSPTPSTTTPTTPAHPECEPKVKTSAVDAKDGDKILEAGVDGKVTDHVTYSDFAAGEYVVVGTLMDQATGKPVEGAAQVEAKHITVAKDHDGGEATIEFTVPAAQVKPGASMVVFEKVYRVKDVDTNGQVKDGAKPYAEHTDINDKAQTVTVPKPETPNTPTPSTPTPTNPCEPTPTPSTSTSTPGTPDSPTPSTSTPGTPDSPTPTTTTPGGNIPEWCTPEVKTTATDAADGDHEVAAGQAVLVKDVVAWKNLPVGSYVVNGALMDKATGEVVPGVTMVKAGTIEVPAGAKADQPKVKDGTVEIVFSVPAGALAEGKEYVVFEDVYLAKDADANGIATADAKSVAQHHDITDGAQTVVVKKPDTPPTPSTPTPSTPTSTPTTPTTTPSEPATPVTTPTTPCDTPTPSTSTPGTPDSPTPSTTTPTTPAHPECEPKVKTSAVDGKDGDKLLQAGVDGKVKDEVSFSDFAAGEYVVVGTLMDQATGKPVPGAAQVEAKHVTVAKDHEGGKVVIEFTVPGAQVKPGASMVVFEKVYRVKDVDTNGQVKDGAKPYAEHTDINDKAQTVTVPKPETPNTPTPSTPTTTPSEPATPVTTPTTPCDNTPTPTPSTSTPGTPATPTGPGTTPATPNQPNTPTECHPTVKTSAVDGTDGDKFLKAGVDGKVKDEVSFSDFAAGEYVVVGTLMDQATGQPVPGAAQVEVKHVTVKADHDGGKVVIEFTVPGSQVKPGASLVVFERVYRVGDVDANGQVKDGATPYAEHTDINDKAQTVTVPKPGKPGTPGKPATPGVTVPNQPTSPVVKVHRFLAKTGVNAGVIAGIAGGIVVAGSGLLMLRRRRDA